MMKLIDYLTGQPLILLHHFLILLVDTEYLADPVGSRLCLRQTKEHYNTMSKAQCCCSQGPFFKMMAYFFPL